MIDCAGDPPTTGLRAFSLAFPSSEAINAILMCFNVLNVCASRSLTDPASVMLYSSFNLSLTHDPDGKLSN